MQIMKKMSVGAMNDIRGGFVVGENSKTFLAARIMGIAQSVKVKTTTFGESLAFNGEFRGINQHGEEFASATCYLVSPADQLLSSALLSADGASVNFAFDIFVSPVPKKTPIDRGYEYKVKPLLETKPSNPLAALMSNVPAFEKPQKALELPLTEKVENPSTEKVDEQQTEQAKSVKKK